MWQRFLNHIELWLSGIGIVLVLLIVQFAPSGVNAWKVAGLAALLIGTLHGVIFYLIRRRQLQVRRTAIGEIRELLSYQVNNRLSVILLKADFPHAMQDSQEHAISQIQEAIEVISVEIERLSEDSLTKWRSQFGAMSKMMQRHQK